MKEELHSARQNIAEMKRQRELERALLEAGKRYLANLRLEGERCIRAMGVGNPGSSKLESFAGLFESEDVELDVLERRVKGLQSELAQAYPTEPVARSCELGLPKLAEKPCWEAFQIGGLNGEK